MSGAELSRSVPLVCLLLSSCTGNEKGKEQFIGERILCPSPAVAQFEPWGKSGVQQICKINHGPFVAFEQGYVQLRGQYKDGKKVGAWYWYDVDGKVIKEVDYSEPGKET